MRETVAAYLLGPAVMVLVCAVSWAISRRSRGTLEQRVARWLDSHRPMHHRH
ncbi:MULTISPECIES: hypothetical protein [unclassified Paraburkholderia]|uniref:hypothetical protein n=1 Tax=unclassified Paraburkholderia TaxID=2615204 RepID=UPI00197EF266|nr:MULTISPECIES: hypothetical protein [unclassified Paraburkholderia]